MALLSSRSAASAFLILYPGCSGRSCPSFARKDNSAVSIYPNPANNQLTVNLNSFSSKQISLKVFDVLGKEIKCEILKSNESSYVVNLSSLNNGAYFIIISDQSQTVTKKFMKQ